MTLSLNGALVFEKLRTLSLQKMVRLVMTGPRTKRGAQLPVNQKWKHDLLKS